MSKAKVIETIGVVGAGTMGSGIASSCAVSGFKTIIYDIKNDIVDNAIGKIKIGFEKLVEKNKIDDERKYTAVKNLIGASGLNELAQCDIIIEAALEDLNEKMELFGKIEKIAGNDTILASNTSSLSITAISTSISIMRERVVGMHFFNPANIMKLIEIIRGEFTSDDIVNTVFELSKKLGKIPVLCKDTPGFIVNRVARAFYGEALKILGEESLPVNLIDIIMKNEGGFAMGPFELMDLIGIDVNLSVTKSVYEAFYYDPKYKPSTIQQKMVNGGMLGRKTKQGFYRYN